MDNSRSKQPEESQPAALQPEALPPEAFFTINAGANTERNPEPSTSLNTDRETNWPSGHTPGNIGNKAMGLSELPAAEDSGLSDAPRMGEIVPTEPTPHQEDTKDGKAMPSRPGDISIKGGQLSPSAIDAIQGAVRRLAADGDANEFSESVQGMRDALKEGEAA